MFLNILYSAIFLFSIFLELLFFLDVNIFIFYISYLQREEV